MAQPSLLIPPQRFSTGKLFAYSPQQSTPVELSVTRSTTAFRTNVSGTLQSVASGIARLDYRYAGALQSCPALLVESAATNSALHSRDLTNAVWVRTNMNATRDQVGADGSANTATRLTATAANATILQSLTLASAQREWSAWIRRITGTGRIEMTMDGGASWVIVTSGITSTFSPIDIPAQTLANNSVGFRIADSGNEIAVDFVQLEAGAVRTSPIITGAATATRNADVISLTGASGLIGQTQGTIYAEVNIQNLAKETHIIRLDDGTSTNTITLRTLTGNVVRTAIIAPTTSGTLNISSATFTAGIIKIAFAYQSGNIALSVNGAAALTANGTFSFGATLSRIFLGSNDNTSFFNDHIRCAAIYKERLTNAELSSLTTL